MKIEITDYIKGEEIIKKIMFFEDCFSNSYSANDTIQK